MFGNHIHVSSTYTRAIGARSRLRLVHSMASVSFKFLPIFKSQKLFYWVPDHLYSSLPVVDETIKKGKLRGKLRVGHPRVGPEKSCGSVSQLVGNPIGDKILMLDNGLPRAFCRRQRGPIQVICRTILFLNEFPPVPIWKTKISTNKPVK